MHPIKIITVEKSRSLEEQANAGGLSFAQMMESAGRGTARAIQKRMALRDQAVLVLVGPGNNGGDGLVAAHYLLGMGAHVTCYVWKRKAGSDPNYERVRQDGVPIVLSEDDARHAALQELLSGADLIVDALLGVGVTRPIGGTLKDLLELVRQEVSARGGSHGLVDAIPGRAVERRPLVVAVDCPSGLDCDTGALDPAALAADVTVTFAYPKAGLLLFPGAEAVGKIVVCDIGIPQQLASDVETEMATPEAIRPWLPARPGSAHKGTFGRALIVAGSVNYVGAAALAGAGASRVGTGLVTMALPTSIHGSVAAQLSEATYLLLPHDLGVISETAVEVVRPAVGDYDALLVGPGLTQENETVAFVQALLGLRQAERRGRIGFATGSQAGESQRSPVPPLVIDADGLNALAMADEWWTALPPETIVTPHPGEMGRLMGGQASASDVQRDRVGISRALSAKWGAIVVLKGAFTVVASPDGRAMVLPFANPGLATAGSGDVLAGAIVGLRAQGMAAFEAAVTGAYLHGLAGELARSDLGDRGVVAGDLAPRLPLAHRCVVEGGCP